MHINFTCPATTAAGILVNALVDGGSAIVKSLDDSRITNDLAQTSQAALSAGTTADLVTQLTTQKTAVDTAGTNVETCAAALEDSVNIPCIGTKRAISGAGTCPTAPLVTSLRNYKSDLSTYSNVITSLGLPLTPFHSPLFAVPF
jgi:hypothetical protein